jgi:membrane peptidoglycan carboxypeptidase
MSRRASRSEMVKPRWRRWLKLGIIGVTVLGLIIFLLGVAAFAYLYNTIELPNPNDDFKAQTSKVYYADGKTLLGTFATQNRESIDLSDMPDSIKDAVVAAENQSFWTDKGIDPKGIMRAFFSNATGGATQGASTITQQYVKIMYLTQERTLTRKVKEAILSLKLQRSMSKEQILEDYLNTIYFGRGAYGIQAAAKAFFDHKAQELTLKESAVLAAILNQPNGSMDPVNGKEAKAKLKERYNYVISSMADMETITEKQEQKSLDKLPKFPETKASSQNGGQKGHMLKLVRDELKALGYQDSEIDAGGLKIVTTFTPEAMKAAADGVVAERPTTAYDGGKLTDKKLHIGVASVEVGTGGLLGFYGGQDFLDSQINWAATGGMAGSTLKPFCLVAALESGFSVKDTFEGNSPYAFSDIDVSVVNEGTGPDGLGNDYGSAVNGITGLEESINTVFVDMQESMGDGPRKVVDVATRMGLPPIEADKRYPGIPNTTGDLKTDDRLVTLGKARVSPINMANAYATFANGGLRSEVHVVSEVLAPSGSRDYNFKAPVDAVVDPDITADVTYAMQQVVESGTGTAASALGRPVAGKTGTATKEKPGEDDVYVSSAWFVATTPQVSTAVMYVRGDGDDQLDEWLPEYFGGSYPARTWTTVMAQLMEGVEPTEFPEPVFVDGDAPAAGHDPTVAPPPPPPSDEASPTKKPTTPAPTTKSPTATVSPSITNSPTGTGSPSITIGQATKRPSAQPVTGSSQSLWGALVGVVWLVSEH